jgi:hypothetical protein
MARSFSSPLLALSTLLALSGLACGGVTSETGTGETSTGGASGTAGQGTAGQGTAGQGNAGQGNAGSAGQGNAGSGAGGGKGGAAGSGAAGAAGSGAAGAAGSGAAGGGSYVPCAGKACGESCSPCDPKDPTCGSSGLATFCSAEGQCVTGQTACGPQCKTTNDCPIPECAPCPGGGGCPTTECVSGQCVYSGGGCNDPCAGKACGESCSTCTGNGCPPVVESCDANGQCVTGQPACGPQCKVATDCPVPDCVPCPGGGSGGCPTADCVGGQCVYSGGGVCNDPCAGKACGDTCSTCAPGELCPPVIQSCDANGQCVPGVPACSTQCVTDANCPQQPCAICPDGSQACSKTLCLQGQCVTEGTTCPVPPPCAPQDIAGVGSCKKLLGFRWDGQSCQAVDGCTCAGVDCAAIYATQDLCTQNNASCLGTACKTDQECPTPKGPCTICPDGVTASCPEGKCVNNLCEVVYPACGATPCSGKKCGDACSNCTGNGCPPVLEYCDINGACGPQQPVCSFP